MRRRVSIFGSTGSVGSNTVDLMQSQGGAETYDVVALTGARNIAKLAKQATGLRADIAVTAFPECLDELQNALAGTGVRAAAGADAILDASQRPTDWAMSAIVGAAGLAPGLTTLGHGGILALANKESLVTAGPLMLSEAKAHGATILPVDSEHSAIFQALAGEDITRVARIILTASGGPFLNWSPKEMAAATPAQAVAHPNWAMGQRISIDSASLFNKAMEVIETKEFFGVDASKIEVLVHPQSVVHSLVEFVDGAILAHLGPHDMRGPIGFALNWPDREPLPLQRLDLARVGQLEFAAPDEQKFPALRLAREVMQMGGLAGAAFNAAKEATLDAFLAGDIGFLDMAQTVELVLDGLSASGDLRNNTISLDNVQAMDHLARIKTNDAIKLRQAS